MPAPWLEPDDQFEGVGAHRLNPRYDPVDEEEPEQQLNLADNLHLLHPRVQRMLTLVSPTTVTRYRLDGHDGSHYQFDGGSVDLQALAAATWVMWWKATQSTSYVDPTFNRVWSQRDLWTHRFPYHWLSSTTDPQQQAAHYLAATGDLVPGDGDMLDAEENGITVDWCLGWVEAVEAVRKKPVEIYNGLYVAGGSIWRSDALREGKYGIRGFHVAAYVTEENLLARMNALGLLPKYDKDAWQFWSGGPVPGILDHNGNPARADMNRVDNRERLNIICGITTVPQPEPVPQPQPQPNPAPSPGDDMKLSVLTLFNTQPPTTLMGYSEPHPNGTDEKFWKVTWIDGNDPQMMKMLNDQKAAGAKEYRYGEHVAVSLYYENDVLPASVHADGSAWIKSNWGYAPNVS